jgi:hypothetical protein
VCGWLSAVKGVVVVQGRLRWGEQTARHRFYLRAPLRESLLSIVAEVEKVKLMLWRPSLEAVSRP